MTGGCLFPVEINNNQLLVFLSVFEIIRFNHRTDRVIDRQMQLLDLECLRFRSFYAQISNL